MHQNILTLMVGCRRVDMHATEDEALEAFNDIVRTEVYSKVLASAGTRAFTYKQYLWLSFVLGQPFLIDIFAKFQSARSGSTSIREALSVLISRLFWLFAGWPGILLLLELFASFRLQSQGCRNRLWISAAALAHGFGLA